MLHSKPRETIKVFGFTDIHWGMRDRQALATAMEAQRIFRPDITVIGGDLLDCSPFSRHRSIKMVESIGRDWVHTELEPALAWLDIIQSRTKVHTYFLEGNHEAWIEKACATSGSFGQAIYDLIAPSINLSRNRSNFTYLTYDGVGTKGSSLQLHRDLMVVHGWTASLHAAAVHLRKSRTRSVIFHHTHRAQRDSSRDPWSGQPIEAFSAGCLCKLQPIYQHGGNPTSWTHGFWIAYLEKKSYTAYPITIHKGRAVMPNGKEVTG